jgi:hypothetical protein
VAISELASSISVTTPEWHYIYSGNGRSELYHWTTDPQESIDLSEYEEGQRRLHVLHVALSHDMGISTAPRYGQGYSVGTMRPEFRSLLDQRAPASEFSFPAGYSPDGAQPSQEDQDLQNNFPYY